MADFEIREIEGMRQICVGIRDEVARARRGALSAMLGEIELTPRLPGRAICCVRRLPTRRGSVRPIGAVA